MLPALYTLFMGESGAYLRRYHLLGKWCIKKHPWTLNPKGCMQKL